MGRWEETKEAYYGREDSPEEKVIPERDKMGLVQALTILHSLRDAYASCEEYGPAEDHESNKDVKEAFNTVFEWIDNVVILLKKSGRPTP